MCTTRYRIGLLLLVSAITASGCGSDSSTDAQSQFNDFEANQVLNAAAAVIENVDTGAPGVAAAVENVNSTLNCANGGTATVNGTRDPGPAIDFDARVNYANCANASVTLNGFIDVTATSSVPSTGVVRVTWTFLGTVTSRKDGQVRSCTMDVTRIRNISSATTTSVSGNLCGRTVSSRDQPPLARRRVSARAVGPKDPKAGAPMRASAFVLLQREIRSIRPVEKGANRSNERMQTIPQSIVP
jgi:hypothetical protein